MVLFSQYINLEKNFSLISICSNINVTDFCRFKICGYLQFSLLNCFSKVTFFKAKKMCKSIHILWVKFLSIAVISLPVFQWTVAHWFNKRKLYVSFTFCFVEVDAVDF